MSYNIEAIFGEEEIRKFDAGKPFTDFEKAINYKKYSFETKAEKNAFYKGISEAVGWREFKVIKEYNTNIASEITEEESFDYWRFIEKYHPKYSSCNNVLLSDILTRKLTGEEISDKDEEYIKDWNLREELLETDKELLSIAFENYFKTVIYPEDK